jgi:hypothetical protein
MRMLLFALLAAAACGCGKDGKQPDFPDLHPVKGTVTRGGAPVKGGAVQFYPDPARPDFLINSEVGADGTYTLSTVRTTDKSGERKPGAPAGTYKVTFTPPLGDQTAGGAVNPIELTKTFTVNAGNNDIPIDLGKK